MERIKPKTRKDQRYAVAIGVEGGNVCPIESYDTPGQLEESLRSYYAMAQRKGITNPVPIEKIDPNMPWDGASCKILRGMLEKIAGEQANARNQ